MLCYVNQSTHHIIIFLEHLSHKKILSISKKIEEQLLLFDIWTQQ